MEGCDKGLTLCSPDDEMQLWQMPTLCSPKEECMDENWIEMLMLGEDWHYTGEVPVPTDM
eukprot:3020095-Karenia_brevis.AAC.1